MSALDKNIKIHYRFHVCPSSRRIALAMWLFSYDQMTWKVPGCPFPTLASLLSTKTSALLQ